ncbi:MAG: bifunctional diguanylate cyclase/phosphodiesterase [Pseudomonadota bacterium]
MSVAPIDIESELSIARATPIDETAAYLDARQAYLDALPLAAAVVAWTKRGAKVLAYNGQFARLDAAGAVHRRAGDILTRFGASAPIRRVLSGEVAKEKYDWRDGGLIDGRHFTINVSQLCPSLNHGARVLVTMIDRTSEVQAGESLRRQILTDPLTGLTNRAGFIETLEARISDDGPEPYAMVHVDLSRFSRVNECVGSLGGDELIITVARRLTTILRGNDLLARTGANEFAVMVRLVDGPGDVIQVARRVQNALAQPFTLSDFEIKIDCAIGCALASDGDGDAEGLFRHAQLALKSAKSTKRVEMYQPSALDAARRRFMIETELRRAIERDELSMAFQPLISLATGKISGFEALARWDHPDHGPISPNEFIAVAEDSGLIVPLGRWALDRAIGTLAAWDARVGYDLPVYVGINLSHIQVARDNVPEVVASTLSRHKIAGQRLGIELTESVIVGDPERAGRTLRALKACDAIVAMDDFGTGFSNLASLQKLPIDMLKIDRSFVTGMLDDPDKVAIVRAVLGLAQALGMKTTAEGVETAELARTLAAMGCTTGQGFHYARALGEADALDFALNSLG